MAEPASDTAPEPDSPTLAEIARPRKKKLRKRSWWARHKWGILASAAARRLFVAGAIARIGIGIGRTPAEKTETPTDPNAIETAKSAPPQEQGKAKADKGNKGDKSNPWSPPTVIAPPKGAPKVLFVLPSTGVWLDDYTQVRKHLEANHVTVVTASTDGGSSKPYPDGKPVPIDKRFTPELNFSEYSAVVFTGHQPDEYMLLGRGSEVATLAIQKMQQAGKPVAAIGLGQGVLAAHGVLKGKRAAACEPLWRGASVHHRQGLRHHLGSARCDGGRQGHHRQRRARVRAVRRRDSQGDRTVSSPERLRSGSGTKQLQHLRTSARYYQSDRIGFGGVAMFQRLIPAAAVVAALGWAVSLAQPPLDAPGRQPKKADQPDTGPKPGAKADGKIEPPAFELRTLDDTVMKVVLLEPSVALVTKYGKLSIPVADVRRLEFGFRYPDGLEEKINKEIADLGSPDFRTREDAEQALAEIGHFAVPALRRAAKSQDPEVVRAAQAVLKFLQGKLGEGKPELRDFDVVETAEFTAKGRLELGALKVRTKYFGEATVKLTDIRSFRSIGSSSTAEFALDAAKYAKMNQADWMETSIEVSSGQQLELTASGKIDQWPPGPGQYMCSPGGLPGYNAGGVVPGGGQRLGVPGQIVGRIGPNGVTFAIGASYKGKVNESGKLYLRISPSPWNCDSTGSYKVTAERHQPVTPAPCSYPNDEGRPRGPRSVSPFPVSDVPLSQLAPAPAPAALYADRLAARRATVAALAARLDALSSVRLGAFLVGLVAAGLSFGAELFSPWFVLLPVAVFVYFVARFEATRGRKVWAERAARFYSGGLDRLAGKPSGAGDGARFADDAHPYATDLDLFGSGSVFEPRVGVPHPRRRGHARRVAARARRPWGGEGTTGSGSRPRPAARPARGGRGRRRGRTRGRLPPARGLGNRPARTGAAVEAVGG